MSDGIKTLPRNQNIGIRFSRDERSLVKRAARIAGRGRPKRERTMADYVRRVAVAQAQQDVAAHATDPQAA